MSKLLLIGLDAADWELLSNKILQGELPHLATLIKTGASGQLRSLHPLFSPALWATIATGKRPYDHGITGFTLPHQSTNSIETYNSSSLRSPSFWHILSAAKKRTNVVGWWNTAPAEEICGTIVDETFRVAHAPVTEPWIATPTSVAPATLLQPLSEKQIHPQKLSASLLQRLVPKLYEINPEKDPRLSAIAKILAEDLTTLEVTLHLMRETEWDCTTLCLMGIDSLSHQGMNYRSPHLPDQDPRSEELYGELVDRAYELYDEWIGTLITAAGKETTVMIISDHGFYHDHRRPQQLGTEATAPCSAHSPLGTIILQGPSVKKGIRLTQATILDICPTILSFFGIPAGRDMPGKALAMAFSELTANARISSWDYLKKKKSLQTAKVSSTEAALRQLVALGYLPALPPNSPRTSHEGHCDQLFHTALAYLNAEKSDQALALLEEARRYAQQQDLTRPDVLQELALLYLELGKERAAAANFRQLVRVRRRDARQAAQELALQATVITPTTPLSFVESWELKNLLIRAFLDTEAMTFMLTLAEAIASHDPEAASTLFLLAEKNPHNPFVNFYTGKIALARPLAEFAADDAVPGTSGAQRRSVQEVLDGPSTGATPQCASAVELYKKSTQKAHEIGLRLLERVAQERPEEASALALIAEHQNATGSFLEAEKTARLALERDPLHAASWLALARALLHQARWQEARQAALQARGSTLRKSELCELLATIATQEKNKNHRRAARYLALAMRAKNALETSVSSHFHSSQKKVTPSHHKKNEIKEFVIVTGIPRSGTSLMMQMLAAGGLPIMTDNLRTADQHNPRGYFEHEKTKTIATDSSFLKAGMATKIVIPLLWELPATLPLKLIYIQRDLNEVIASQHRMAGVIASREELEHVYRSYERKTEEFIALHAWPVLRLSYASVLAEPHSMALKINQFLEHSLSITAMAAIVDPALHQMKPSESRDKTNLTRIFHTDRDEEVAKADGARRTKDFDRGCMSTYCPDHNSSPTQHPSGFPASAVDQYEISGLTPMPVRKSDNFKPCSAV